MSQLSKDRRFSYETYTRSLCASDKIRILQDSGGRLYEGKSCSLGRFQPIERQDLIDFLEQRETVPEPEPTAPAEVEDVVKDES